MNDYKTIFWFVVVMLFLLFCMGPLLWLVAGIVKVIIAAAVVVGIIVLLNKVI